MATVQVRYIVNDVDAAIAFYDQHLGFRPSCIQHLRSRCCREATSVWC